MGYIPHAEPAGLSAATQASLAATSATLWKPNTAYAAGQAVVNPSGFIVTALTGFTSGASYSAANWSDAVGAAYSPLVGDAQVPVAVPAGLGWDTTILPGLTLTRSAHAGGLGVASITPEAAFDLFSTARSNPTTTYYVATTGSDSAAGTSSGAPLATMAKATQLGNATGAPYQVVVTAGTYPRTAGPCYLTKPSQDTAWIASGGRVITGAFDSFTATADATYTATYSYAITNVCRVVDLANLDRDGNAPDLASVTTPALCNVKPNSWCLSSGTIYINRGDGAAVTSTNTRVYRTNSFGFQSQSAPVSTYFGALSPADGFDIEGGSAHDFMFVATTATTTRKATVAVGCSFKYPGGNANAANSVAFDSWPGLVYLSRCRADRGMADGFNVHNTLGAGKTYVLTVNCSGFNNGLAPNGSCNGHTGHEDVVMIDLCGTYRGNHGGACAYVGNAKTLLAGTHIADDRGDLGFGASNSLPPTAVYVRDTAEAWLDGVTVDMPAGTRAFYTLTNTSKIHLHNCDPGRSLAGGAGVVDTY